MRVKNGQRLKDEKRKNQLKIKDVLVLVSLNQKFSFKFEDFLDIRKLLLFLENERFLKNLKPCLRIVNYTLRFISNFSYEKYDFRLRRSNSKYQ